MEHSKGMDYLERAFAISKVVILYLEECKNPVEPQIVAAPVEGLGGAAEVKEHSSLENPDVPMADVIASPAKVGPISLYQVVLTQPDSAYYIRSLLELNNEFNFLWVEEP